MSAGIAGRPCFAGEVGLVDQLAQRVGDLGGPHRVGVDLRGVGKIAQQVSTAKLVDQRAELGGVVVLVAVVHDHRAGQVGDHERGEGVQGPVAEQVVGVELGAGDQQVALGLLLPAGGCLGPTRSGVSSQHTACARVISARIRWWVSVSSPAARLIMPCTNPTEGAVPVSDSSSATTRCAGMKCTTIRYTANAARLGPYPTGPDRAPSGRWAVWSFPQPHCDLVLVVLGDLHRDLRDLVLLVAVHDPQIPGVTQIITALAAALGEPVAAVIGVVGPGQVRPRRPGLLAPRPLRPTLAALVLLRRCGLARIIIARGRARGVPRVTRQQMLQPGQLAGQGLVGLHQLRDSLTCGPAR